MHVTSDMRCRIAQYSRIAAMLLFLLPAVTRAAGDSQTLLTVVQKRAVIGTFSLAALEAAGAVTAKVEDESGQSADYTGAPISQLLESVGVRLGKSVRGERLIELGRVEEPSPAR